MSTVRSTSFETTYFSKRFILNEKKNVIDNFLPFVVPFPVLLSNIYRKNNFMAKTGSDLCNFYSKLDFWKISIQ